MKRAPHLILAAAVLATLLLGAFTTQREEPIDRLMAALQKWAGVHLQEKVYLHMDKPYYALGDTIWFKGYVTIGSRHQLSKLSGALYVELIDERDSLLSSLKLPLTAGMAMGDFTLGDAYRAGNYRIRAYTRWMRNAGVDYFFDKSFVVGDFLELTAGLEKPTELPESRQEQYELAEGRPVDIQFFPEGGNMVNGLYGRMAFKAVGTDGRGVDVSGKIIDNNGLEVTSFQSTHAGMGVFNILPEAGKIYQAKISLKDGTQKNISLPKPIDEGYTLAVYQPGGDSLLVRINATETMYKDARSVNLLVQSGGETIFGSKVKVSQKINSVWLRKSEFPSGIAQFTLFNEQAVPLNERIVFIKSNDRMELDILAPKQIYNSRERVDMELESRDRNGRLVPGNFSVAVIDESKLPSDEDDETSIFSSLLLSSDLKGYIERPNFYFTKDTVQTNKALDNLMLTQGYRRFVWKEILDAAPPKPLYRAESLGTELSGRVLTLSGKPVANGSVTLVSLTPGFLEVTKTDTAGRFRYEPIMLADSLRFALQARGDKNTKKVEVILDSVARQALGKNKNRPDFVRNIPEQTSVYLESSRKQDGLLEKKGMTSRVNRLKEVRIRARKIATEDMSSQGGVQIPDGHADFIYKMGDGDHCVSIAQCLQGRLGAVIFKPYPANNPEVLSFPHFKNAPMEVFLDGRRLRAMFEFTEIFDGAKLSPEDILKIDLVTSNQALMSIYSEGNARTPAIFIYTRKTRKPKYNPAMLNIKPKGFNSARVFYAPRYDRPVLSHQLPDLRSTIYWNAKMKTFASGRGRFSFFNADGPGTYKVVVEGINAAGELGRKVYRYEVKGGGKAMTNDLTAIDGQSAELVKAIQALQQIKPAEKLYVHTDRSFYNIGDTLWFKAYLFDASSLVASKRSGILYVELNDDSAENVRRISIPLKNGVGHAQIPLTRKIFHEGGYTFRAYTNWMQNFGAHQFFSKRFYLGVPAKDTWLVKSTAKVVRNGEMNQIQAEVVLSNSDQTAAGLREIEVKLMEGDRIRKKENLQTTVAGKLALNYELKDKTDGRNLRLELKTLHKNDGNQRLIVPLNANRPEQVDLQFLPEGGYLVAGLQSTVGFKSIAENGKGIDISGKVYDSKENEVAVFASSYKGMGSFTLKPKPGETYFARVQQPEELTSTYQLPAVKLSGTVMNISGQTEGDSLEVKVSSTAQAMHADSSYFLTGVSRGTLTYLERLDMNKKSYRIARDRFPAGITRFSLLRNRTPLNERMVYITRPDTLQIILEGNKNNYLKRDSVVLDLTVKDKTGTPVSGSFSLAVTDDSQVKPDSEGNFNMAPTLLLGAELKGEIETPGYYFSRNLEALKALDQLMLTQGWTGYDWKAVFDTAGRISFKEEPFFKVTGLVNNVARKPIPGAQVLISSKKPFFITETAADQNGRYTFQNLPPIDSGSFFIQAKTPKGKSMNFGEVTVDRFKPALAADRLLDQILPWYVNSDPAQLNYVKRMVEKSEEKSLKQTGIALKEVKIVDRKLIKGSYNRNISKGSDLALDEKDIKESGVLNLYELLKQKLPGIKVVLQDGLPTLKLNKYMVVIEIDGGGLPVKLDVAPTTDQLIEQLSEFKIDGFVGLEVFYSRKYTANYLERPSKISYTGPEILASQASLLQAVDFILEVDTHHPKTDSSGYSRLYTRQPFYKINYPESAGYLEYRANVLTNNTPDIAVIGITTRSDRGWFKINKPDIASYRPQPVMRPLEFYSPKYRSDNANAAEPDFRPTIYWKPDIYTDASGKARVVFYTSDVSGRYSVNLQGSDMEGTIGSASSVIKVGVAP